MSAELPKDDHRSSSVTELIDAIFVSVVVGNNKTLPPYLKGYRPGCGFKATTPITFDEATPPPSTKENGTSTTNKADSPHAPPAGKDIPDDKSLE